MAGKLFVVLFAFLAVQGWTSAGVIPDEFVDLLDNVDFLELESFDNLPLGDLTKLDIDTKKAENCVPYIPKAYSAAKEVQKIVGEAKKLVKKLQEAAKKCSALTDAEEKKKCFKYVKEQAESQGKPIVEAYKKIRPQVIQSMADFDKCMTA